MKIQITDTDDPKIREAITGFIVEYNIENAGRSNHRPLAVLLKKENDEIAGGLWGRTSYDWLFVELLFVPEPFRGQGLGRKLMRAAEQEAISRGCHSAWLDTFEFQARGFYERLGYAIFGTLNEYPIGFSRYFLKKSLTGRKRSI